MAEALAAQVTLVEAAASSRFGRTATERGLLDEIVRRGVPVRRLDEWLLSSLSELEASPGLLAIAERPRFDEAALFRDSALILIAVGVQNPGNLGALLRTAEAAGATGAYLTSGCADPFSWKALRGSMGSAFRLSHVGGLSGAEAMQRARARGLQALATEPTAPVAYDEVDLTRPTALLVGAEGSGLPAALAAAADVRVRVPMRPPVESLNLSVASGVILFEAARQRRR